MHRLQLPDGKLIYQPTYTRAESSPIRNGFNYYTSGNFKTLATLSDTKVSQESFFGCIHYSTYETVTVQFQTSFICMLWIVCYNNHPVTISYTSRSNLQVNTLQIDGRVSGTSVLFNTYDSGIQIMCNSTLSECTLTRTSGSLYLVAYYIGFNTPFMIRNY